MKNLHIKVGRGQEPLDLVVLLASNTVSFHYLSHVSHPANSCSFSAYELLPAGSRSCSHESRCSAFLRAALSPSRASIILWEKARVGYFERTACILSIVKQITSPGGMHETSACAWCTGKTQRNRVEREVGEGIGMGNTCNSMADSCQCMTKPTTIL